MLTHGNMLSTRVLKDYWGWVKGDVLLHALPIFHVHGLFVASPRALLNGSRMIWFASSTPGGGCRSERVHGRAHALRASLAEAGFGREACRNMRLFIRFGAADRDLPTSSRRRSDHTILERYGMSETVMLTSNPTTPRTARAAAHTWARCRAWACASPTTGAACAPAARSAASGPGRTSSGATGACRRRRKRSSPRMPPTAGSRPATCVDRRRPSPSSGAAGPHHHRQLQRLPGRDRVGYLNEMDGVAGSAVIGVRTPISARAWWRWWWANRAPDAADAGHRAEAKIANYKGAQALLRGSTLPRNLGEQRCRRTCCATLAWGLFLGYEPLACQFARCRHCSGHNFALRCERLRHSSHRHHAP